MSKAMYLQSVICIDTSESGKDEVYVKYSIDGGSSKRYPKSGYHSMSGNEFNPWITNLKFVFNQTVEIKLYDKDDVSSDDLLGSHLYKIEDAPKTESQLVMNSDEGSRYVLVTGAAV